MHRVLCVDCTDKLGQSIAWSIGNKYDVRYLCDAGCATTHCATASSGITSIQANYNSLSKDSAEWPAETGNAQSIVSIIQAQGNAFDFPVVSFLWISYLKWRWLRTGTLPKNVVLVHIGASLVLSEIIQSQMRYVIADTIEKNCDVDVNMIQTSMWSHDVQDLVKVLLSGLTEGMRGQTLQIPGSMSFSV